MNTENPSICVVLKFIAWVSLITLDFHFFLNTDLQL